MYLRGCRGYSSFFSFADPAAPSEQVEISPNCKVKVLEAAG